MNVCALDVLARSADFESVASTLEMRAWEWDFLHDVDGETPLGDIARRSGIELDSAIGVVHDAMHRGLVFIPTMTLETYRLRMPTQTALRGSSATLSLGTSAVAEPPLEIAPPAPSPSAISFSSDAFDWNAPEPEFDDTDASDESVDLAAAHATPGGVHYDDRFGVEHPGGPFATTHQHDAPLALEAQHDDDAFAITSHPADEYATPPSHEVAFAVTAGHDVEPLVAPAHFDEPFVPMAHHEEPVAEVTHLDDPFAIASHHDEPIALPAAEFVAEAPHHDDASTFDPFAVVSHYAETPADAPHAVDDPFAAPSENGTTHTNGTSLNGHTPVRFDELFAEAAPQVAPYDEPAVEHHAPTNGASTNGHTDYASVTAPIQFDAASFTEAPIESHFDDVHDEAVTHEAQSIEAQAAVPEPAVAETPVSQTAHVAHVEEPAHDDTPGSISFSFSADEPAGDLETYEAPSVREAPEVWTPPVAQIAEPPAPAPEPVKAQQPQAAAPAKSAPDARLTQTQSTYFEREAIDTDAGRELEAKGKNWKDSLTWREQQELNEAIGTGTEKAGVIGTLLRALGVR